MTEVIVDDGRRVFELLCRLSLEEFSLDLPAASAGRNHELWALGIDSRRRCFHDLLGNIDEAGMAELSRPERFFDTDAGFKVSAQSAISLPGKQVDIFLLNVAHFSEGDTVLAPLLIHELCHYVEDSGLARNYQFETEDEANALVILDGYVEGAKRWHSLTWAKLLARAARVAASKNAVASVRQFLELAIPPYDRPGWQPDRIQEPKTNG
jgi:hypothetical protein